MFYNINKDLHEWVLLHKVHPFKKHKQDNIK